MRKRNVNGKAEKGVMRILAMLLCIVVLCGFVSPAKAAVGFAENETPAEETAVLAEVPEVPAELSAEVDNAPGVDVLVEGTVPENTSLKAEAVNTDQLGLAKAFMDENIPVNEGEMREYYAFDISLINEKGKEVEPEGEVTVSLDGLPVNENINILNIKEDVNNVNGFEVIPAAVDPDGKVTFTANGGSVFFFTVDFEYEGYKYSIPGESEILLSDLFKELNIGKRAADAVEVTFSDETLVSVAPVYAEDGVTCVNWKLSSKREFHTEELLTVIFNDGSEIRINTTDDEYTTIYLDVDSSDPTIKQFEYTIEYEGLDFTYNINDHSSQVLTGSGVQTRNKKLTVEANSRITIKAKQGTYFTVTETPVDNVKTFVQLGSDKAVETNTATLGPMWFSETAVCYKHVGNTGFITLKKEVTGAAPEGKEYQFSVVHHYGAYRFVEDIVTIPAGQTSVSIPYTHQLDEEPAIYIAELNRPADATESYKVNGSAVAFTTDLNSRFYQDVCGYNDTKWNQYKNLKWIKFTTQSSQPDIAVVCTNAFPNKYGLTVSKAVSGKTDNTTAFPFELTVTDANNIPISFVGTSLPSGVGIKSGTTNVLTFSLKNNGSITLSKIIPENAKVTLKETSHNGYDVSMTKSGTTNTGDSWQFSMTKDESVAVTNTAIKTADVTLSKAVEGSLGDLTKVFRFTVEYTDKDGKSQKETIDLKNGESRKFTVRENTKVTITETEYTGYQTTYSVNSADAASGRICTLDKVASDTSVKFINTKDAVPDTGIELDSLPFILSLCVVLLFAAVSLLRSRVRNS